MIFKGKKILVVGLGISGQAAVRFFLDQGAEVAVTDLGSPPPSGSFGQLECHWGSHPTKIFEKRSLILVSPGVPLNLPGLKWARRHRIPIIGEFGLAAERLKSPMIAVTGTNGKSTTVTLIARILEAAGIKTALTGNIGRPLLDVVMEDKKQDWIVAEVSSYQLETVRKFHPRVGVLLNITPDHLDRYRFLRDYARAKFRLFKEQTSRDLLIYREEDPVILQGIRRVQARKIGFPSEQLFHSNYSIFYRPSKKWEEYPLGNVRLVGLHNKENMMASIAATRFAGVSPPTVQKGLEDFQTLPHRTELVREHQGVRYYDDSKGTNVDAVVKSLADFPDRSVILIAGGRDKGGSYLPLKTVAKKKVKQAILFGEAKEKMAKSLQDSTTISLVEDLKEAVSQAAARAVSGDIVLLSPACSSFDQFRDYKERGELFQKLVREL